MEVYWEDGVWQVPKSAFQSLLIFICTCLRSTEGGFLKSNQGSPLTQHPPLTLTHCTIHDAPK